jgi:hypothetical protein
MERLRASNPTRKFGVGATAIASSAIPGNASTLEIGPNSIRTLPKKAARGAISRRKPRENASLPSIACVLFITLVEKVKIGLA